MPLLLNITNEGLYDLCQKSNWKITRDRSYIEWKDDEFSIKMPVVTNALHCQKIWSLVRKVSKIKFSTYLDAANQTLITEQQLILRCEFFVVRKLNDSAVANLKLKFEELLKKYENLE
jgi:hypothetical protein